MRKRAAAIGAILMAGLGCDGGATTGSGGAASSSTGSESAASTTGAQGTSSASTTTSGAATSTGSTTTGTGGGGGAGNAPVHLVVLGASTSCGKNLDAPQYGGEVGGLAFSWVNRLAAALQAARPGSVVDNLCKAGYATYQAMPTGTVNPVGTPAVDPARNITAALALSPDAIIVSFPASDAASNIPEIMSNLHTIEAAAATQSVPIWVSTPQPTEAMTGADLAKKLELRGDVLQDFAPRSLDFWAPLVGPNDTWDQTKELTDGVHPNKVGHALLFDVVVAADIPGAIGL